MLLIVIIANVAIWAMNYSFRNAEGNFEMQMLDVGQGDSILIKTPSNFYGLIDGGKGSVVLEELAETLPIGYKNLKFVIATHPDADHVEGLIKVLKRYEVEYLFIQNTPKDNELIDELYSVIKSRNISNYSFTELNDFNIDGVNFDVVWAKENNSVFEDINDSSISLLIEYKNLSIFSGGDLSSEFEVQALNKDIDILKAGHHGSKTSSNQEFLNTIQPEVTLISVGENNSYHHPNSEVLNNLAKINSVVFRTDLNGRIRIIYQNNQIEIIPEEGARMYLNP